MLPPGSEFMVEGVSGNTVSLDVIGGPHAGKLSLKRVTKAKRREPAEKRAPAPADTGMLAEKVQRAAQMPLRYCVASQALEGGRGIVPLARGSGARLAIGGFLIDLRVCVREVYFRIDDETAFKLQVGLWEA